MYTIFFPLIFALLLKKEKKKKKMISVQFYISTFEENNAFFSFFFSPLSLHFINKVCKVLLNYLTEIYVEILIVIDKKKPGLEKKKEKHKQNKTKKKWGINL